MKLGFMITLTDDAIDWLANHVTGPSGEKKPFGCYWCGGTVIVHKIGANGEECPAYAAVHMLDDK